MNSITAGQFADKLREALNIASSLNPSIALAAAGVNALTELFGKSGELNTMMQTVYAETAENAPEVAQAVSDYFTSKGDAMLASFARHPGE